MSKNKTVNELFDLMYLTTHLIKEQIKSQNTASLLTPANVAIIKFVVEKNAPTMKEIADYLKVSAPAATAFIDSLIKAKYLKRLKDHNDRRIIRISITPLGKRKLDELYTFVRVRVSSVLATLTENQNESLHEIFDILIKNLK